MASVKKKPTSVLTTGLKTPTKPKKSVAKKSPGINNQNQSNSSNSVAKSYSNATRTAQSQVRRPSIARAPEPVIPQGGGLPPGMQARGPEATMPTPTGRGEALRIDAQEQYGRTIADLNYQAYQAALAYGDPTTLAQFSQFGPVVDNPNSALNQIRRAEGTGIQDVSDANLRNNTWSSSIRLGDQQRVSDEAGRQRLAAKDSWDRAYYDWNLRLSDAWRTLQGYLGQANQHDIEDTLAREPEPTYIEEAPQGPASVAAPSSPAPRTNNNQESQRAKAEAARQRAENQARQAQARAQQAAKKKRK